MGSDSTDRIIAIDFDGCLCDNAYPGIGNPHWNVILEAVEEHYRGAKLILWTCREGTQLMDAVKACASWGLRFDAINDNIPSTVTQWGTNPRKVGATEYWDDRAVKMDGRFTRADSAVYGRKRLTSIRESRKKVEAGE